MFIFAENRKEIIVSAGTVVACLALMALAAQCAYRGGFDWIIAVVFVSTATAIYMGMKLGYKVARVLFCVLIVAIGSFAVHPFTCDDFLGNNDAYWGFLLRSSLRVAIGCIAFFSLGEHAKLRGLN